LLARIIEEAFGLSMDVSPYREEAAYGAAVLALASRGSHCRPGFGAASGE
jgi:hypothetical protein